MPIPLVFNLFGDFLSEPIIGLFRIWWLRLRGDKLFFETYKNAALIGESLF